MATLETLTKLTQKKLEDIQKRIVALDMELAALAAAEGLLKEQIGAGYDVAKQVDVMAGYQDAGAFIRRAEQEQEEIDKRRTELTEKKEGLLMDMRTLFSEKKRYEVLWDAQKEQEKRARLKKNQESLEDLTNR
ncbi:MAG: hypothetical protein OXR68_02035 [Alphaproteobacteria bacterium]|nr:hypothetical protein [Alphaproteobacteria bacterium]MDD9919390.1 hypothetical protein [Alphaproteobacteria bacterium]